MAFLVYPPTMKTKSKQASKNPSKAIHATTWQPSISQQEPTSLGKALTFAQ